MNKQVDDILEFDDSEAVKFIMDYLPEDAKKEVDDTMIEYVLDVVYEFYEEKGLIEEDSAEDAVIDEEEMLQFILKCAKKDKIALSEELIDLILEGEYEYGKSLGIYNEEEE
jgi:hypothetical protein